jgi:hypothetical protein
MFGADLVEPYYVKLVDPVQIPLRTWSRAKQFWSTAERDVDDWKMWLRVEVDGLRSSKKVRS